MGLGRRSAAIRRHPQDHVAGALASPAIGIQLVEDAPLKPNQTVPVLVDLVLEAHRAERKRSGDRLECGLADGDADQERSASPEQDRAHLRGLPLAAARRLDDPPQTALED